MGVCHYFPKPIESEPQCKSWTWGDYGVSMWGHSGNEWPTLVRMVIVGETVCVT